jgi:hypothetical protein
MKEGHKSVRFSVPSRVVFTVPFTLAGLLSTVSAACLATSRVNYCEDEPCQEASLKRRAPALSAPTLNASLSAPVATPDKAASTPNTEKMRSKPLERLSNGGSNWCVNPSVPEQVPGLAREERGYCFPNMRLIFFLYLAFQATQVEELNASHVELEASLKIARSNLALAEKHAESLEDALRRRPLRISPTAQPPKAEEPVAEERAPRAREKSATFWRINKRKQSPGRPPPTVPTAPPTPPPRSSTSHSTYSDEGRSLRHTPSNPALPKTPLSALFGYDQVPPPPPLDAGAVPESPVSSPLLRQDISDVDRHQLQAHAVFLHNTLEETRAAHASLQAAHASLSFEQQGLRDSHAKLQVERDKLQTAYHNLQSEVEALSQSLFEEANRMVADERRAKSAVDKELERTTAEVAELKHALQAAGGGGASDNYQREVLEQENRDLRSRIAELELEAELGLSGKLTASRLSSLAPEAIPLPDSRAETPDDPLRPSPSKRWFDFRRSRQNDEPVLSTPSLTPRRIGAQLYTPNAYFDGHRALPELNSFPRSASPIRSSRFTPTTTASSSSCESRPSVLSSFSTFDDRMPQVDSPRTAATSVHDFATSEGPFSASTGSGSPPFSFDGAPPLPTASLATRPQIVRRPSVGDESNYDRVTPPQHKEDLMNNDHSRAMPAFHLPQREQRKINGNSQNPSRGAAFGNRRPENLASAPSTSEFLHRNTSERPPSSTGRLSSSTSASMNDGRQTPLRTSASSFKGRSAARPSNNVLSIDSAESSTSRRRPSTGSIRSQPDETRSTRSSSSLPQRPPSSENANGINRSSKQSTGSGILPDDLDVVRF